MRSRLSFWSRQRKPVASQEREWAPNMEEERKKVMDDVRNESLGPVARLTNHFLYSHIHTLEESPRWAVCVTSLPLLPALLIRQVTTVRVLAMGQRRHSLASGTWNSNSNSLPLTPPITLIFPYPLGRQEYQVMGWEDAEWAVIGKVSPQNKHVMVDLILVRQMAVCTLLKWTKWSNLQHRQQSKQCWLRSKWLK